MKITSLVENTTQKDNIKSEHGLSLYIETLNHKILFDTGQTTLFYDNAKTLGIDLKKVDTCIISHGHYDHGGGIMKFLEINKTANVYLSDLSFIPHYNGKEKYIGLNKDLMNDDRIKLLKGDYEIDSRIKIYSSKSFIKNYDAPTYNLNMVENGQIVPDNFLHEQYLLIKESNKMILFSGCSHNGILNIEKWFEPDILIGGFHLSKLDPDNKDQQKVLDNTGKILSAYKTKYYTCHCTGVTQYNYLKKYFNNDKLSYLHCGDKLEI